jgi:hypothetical protein
MNIAEAPFLADDEAHGPRGKASAEALDTVSEIMQSAVESRGYVQPALESQRDARSFVG